MVKANETEMGAAIFIKNGVGKNFEFGIFSRSLLQATAVYFCVALFLC